MPKKMGFYQSPRSTDPKVYIHQYLYFDWPEDIREEIVATISIIWLSWLDTTVELKIQFLKNLTGSSIAAQLACAAYDDDLSLFQFALQPMYLNRNKDEFRSASVKTAAHEAMHAVQFGRGESPTLGAQLIQGQSSIEEELNQYQQDPFEIEAENEADAFIFSIAGSEAQPTSTYSEKHDEYSRLWKEYKSGTQLWRGMVKYLSNH